MEAAVFSDEDQMLSDYGFSISVDDIVESSRIRSFSSFSSQSLPTGSEKNAHVISNHVNPGSPNKIRHKRRKTMNNETQTVKTTNLTDDGYGWRKYGQKTIQKKLHPKSYYRCTHHKEEKCEAKKWVQQESENPSIYKTTYLGHHTCKNPHKIPQIFFPDYPSSPMTSYSPILMRFDAPTTNDVYFSMNGGDHEHMVKSRDEGLNSSSPRAIPSLPWSDNSMILFDDHLFHQNSQQIPSPHCGTESYVFDMMIQELLAHDNVDFMPNA